MVTSKIVANSLIEELADELVYFSEIPMNKVKANFMAKKTLESVNFDNPIIVHLLELQT
ncbi:hypothetical protein [Psychrobacillus sp. L4]|uniref:hypothetical protein n=1 Tax=Psychrobacillus sp. L4 TaxID=3236892 RepID=UPI0036F34137